NVIFDGIIGKSLPAGISKAQAVAGLRAQGHGRIADLVSGSNVVPGHGIDFTRLGQILALAALVYLLASGLTWLLSYIMAGVAQVHTGHALVQVFGRRRKAIEEFSQTNQALYEASFRAQFLSGIIMPAMAFLGNVNYVVIAAVGGYRVATGSITLGDVQAFIQYSRQFTMPITQLAGQLNLLQSGLASAERVFEFLDSDEEAPDQARGQLREPQGEVA